MITADRDFGELIFRSSRASIGVILVRISELPPESRAEIVNLVIEEHQSKLVRAFTVLTPGRIRIRPGL